MKKISATLLVLTASTAHANPYFNDGDGRRPVAKYTSDVMEMFEPSAEDGFSRSSTESKAEMVSMLAECVESNAGLAEVSSILLDDLFEGRTLLSVVDENEEESWADTQMSDDAAEINDAQTDSAVDDCLMERGIYGVECPFFDADADSGAADKTCEEAAKGGTSVWKLLPNTGCATDRCYQGVWRYPPFGAARLCSVGPSLLPGKSGYGASGHRAAVTGSARAILTNIRWVHQGPSRRKHAALECVWRARLAYPDMATRLVATGSPLDGDPHVGLGQGCDRGDRPNRPAPRA